MQAIAVGGEPELIIGPEPERGLPSFIHGELLPGARAILFERGKGDLGGIGVFSLESGDVVWVSERSTNQAPR